MIYILVHVYLGLPTAQEPHIGRGCTADLGSFIVSSLRRESQAVRSSDLFRPLTKADASQHDFTRPVHNNKVTFHTGVDAICRSPEMQGLKMLPWSLERSYTPQPFVPLAV